MPRNSVRAPRPPSRSRSAAREGHPVRDLHAEVHRGRPRAGVQLAGRPARGRRGVHRQPAARGLAGGARAYDDGGYTGGNMDRPALQRLLADIEAGKVDCVVVYKVDRLSRSLMDFARIMEMFDKHGVTFVSVTQQFNTTHSMGRLTLNILLSFAQFEREIISERTRDKMSAARRKGKWIGGHPVLGYDIDPKGGGSSSTRTRRERVRTIYESVPRARHACSAVCRRAERRGWRTKQWTTEAGKTRGGKRITKSGLHGILTNALYSGMVDHKGALYPGEHERIIEQHTWDESRNPAGERRGNGLPQKQVRRTAARRAVLRPVRTQP